MDWVTTTIMLDRLRDFEDVAWEQFVGRFRGPIIDFARRNGLDDTAAQDVAQEALLAFADAYRDGRYDRSRGRLRSWLFGIAHKEVLRHRRRAARAERQAPGTLSRTTFFATVPDPDEARTSWDAVWDQHTLRRSLEVVEREVTQDTYRAFELFALRRMPAADVAAELGTTRNAVFIAKHRVLRRLSEIHRELEGEA